MVYLFVLSRKNS